MFKTQWYSNNMHKSDIINILGSPIIHTKHFPAHAEFAHVYEMYMYGSVVRIPFTLKSQSGTKSVKCVA